MNYTIYRSKAALRFTLSRRNSAFIEAAPILPGREQQVQKGEKKYDWENQKLAMAVSPEELLAIAAACESLRIKGTSSLPSLYHDPKVGDYNGNPKQLKIEPYTSQKSKTQFIAILNLSEVGKDQRRFSIGLTYANLYGIQVFATRAATVMLGWEGIPAEKEAAPPREEKESRPEPKEKPEEKPKEEPKEEPNLEEDIIDDIPF